MQNNKQKFHNFLGPKYWIIWISLAVLRLSCFLKYPTQIKFGQSIGRIFYYAASGRRAIVKRNLSLAFPDLSEEKRDEICVDHFAALGVSLIEMALSRWASNKKLRGLTRIEGKQHLEEALSKGIGIIFLSAHFTTLEIGGRLLSLYTPPFDIVYRPNRNNFITEILNTTRAKFAHSNIEKNNIKTMIKNLRQGIPVWYAPDQSYNRKQSAIISFFGVPAMTNIATSALAKLGNSIVVPYFPRRLKEGGYLLTIKPPIENFPSNNPIEDTKKYISILENHIRQCPEQYFWIHRKYKNLPDPFPNFYEDLES